MQAKAAPSTDPVQRPESPAAAYRLELTWRGRVVDVVPVSSRRWKKQRLSGGGTLQARRRGPEVEVRLDGRSHTLAADATLELGRDAHLAVRTGPQAHRVVFRPRVDSLLLHALMLAAAVQVVVVSALWMTPEPDDDPGAGWRIQELRRYLRPASGTAKKKGEGTVIRLGRAPQEAERPTPVPQRGTGPAPVRSVKPVTLADALAALERAVQGGAMGINLRETIGDVALSTARAPTEGAGMGGLLAPRELLDVGAGSGVLGIGQSRMRRLLEERRVEDEPIKRRRRTVAPKVPEDLEEKRRRPTTTVAGPEESELAGLDPVVRDQLTRAVRRRQSNVRYCYETWALQSDPDRTGRVVLELTLRPDGYVDLPDLRHDDPSFGLMAECVERMAKQWYLGDGLVTEPVRLAFPFILQPKHAHTADFTGEPLEL